MITENWKLVPLNATPEMEAAAVERVRPLHDLDDKEWRQKIPGDLFRLAWPAMLAVAPAADPPPAPGESTAWPIKTDDQVEALAKECGWRNRGYMTTADYSIWCDQMRRFARLAATPLSAPEAHLKFGLGERVQKTKGSSWHGRIVGFYSTDMTPVGYAVESEREPGSVQIYPEAALATSAEAPE